MIGGSTSPKGTSSSPVKKAVKVSKATKSTGGGGGKKLTTYQRYMKDELPKYKAAHTEMGHRDAFSAVAKQWSTASINPNRK